jgi:hypothetical protein
MLESLEERMARSINNYLMSNGAEGVEVERRNIQVIRRNIQLLHEITDPNITESARWRLSEQLRDRADQIVRETDTRFSTSSRYGNPIDPLHRMMTLKFESQLRRERVHHFIEIFGRSRARILHGSAIMMMVGGAAAASTVTVESNETEILFEDVDVSN